MIIRISGETASSTRKWSDISKKYFLKIVDQIFEKLCIYINACSVFIINSRIIICISAERAWHSLEENEAIFSKKYFSKILDVANF